MLLKIEDLHVKYGNVEALHGINIEAAEGEIVCILGANGAGKSTTLMSISGLVKASSGTITYDGKEIQKANAHHIVKSGIAQVPEGRRIFPYLTVAENLDMGAFLRKDKDAIKQDLAGSWVIESSQQAHEGRLTGPCPPRNAHARPGWDSEGDVR